MESYTLTIIVVSLLLSAFFSGMEIAFVSANRFKIEIDAKKGNYLATIISNFQKKPSRFIGTMLVGNNIALVMYGIYMARVLDPAYTSLFSNTTLVFILTTISSTLVILFTAEFLPKAIFRINPNPILLFFAIPLFVIYYILLLPMLLVTGLAELILKPFVKNAGNNAEGIFGRIDLENFMREVAESNEDQEDLDHEIQIFQNALDFSKVKARECMVPRTEIVAIEVDEPIEKLKEKFVETGLSKILVYRGNIDNIIGYVHSYELFKRPVSIKEILMPVVIVPQTMVANEVLETFIKQRRSMAVVVDEFGGTSGILTIEDIMEEIFGEIEDEHDVEELTELEIEPGVYELSARLEIDYLNDEFKLNLPESEDYETLGGFIIHHHESIPEEGEEIKIDDFLFKIRHVEGNRITLVELRMINEE